MHWVKIAFVNRPLAVWYVFLHINVHCVRPPFTPEQIDFQAFFWGALQVYYKHFTWVFKLQVLIILANRKHWGGELGVESCCFAKNDHVERLSGVPIEVYRANVPKSSPCTFATCDKTLRCEQGAIEINGILFVEYIRATSRKSIRCERGLREAHSLWIDCQHIATGKINAQPFFTITLHYNPHALWSTLMLKLQYNAWCLNVQPTA